MNAAPRMLNALFYLRLTSFKNWLLVRLKSLRQPKQLAGAAMFALYFWFFFLRHWTSNPASRGSHQVATDRALQAVEVTGALQVDWLPVAAAFGAVGLFTFLALMWIVPTQRAALGFTEAEIAFLFPAPVTRRALVHFRLLSGQFRSLIGAAIMMLISNKWSFLGGTPLTHALGWWFVFSAMNLHYTGANFTLTRLTDAGIGTARRRILLLLLFAAVIGATAARLPAALRLPVVDGPAILRPIADWIVTFAGTMPLSWMLWPIERVIAPFLAADLRAFFGTLAPALGIIVLHYLWVVRSAVAFEDASIESAQKRSARITAWRSGNRRFGEAPTKARREPFALAGLGRAETAFLWKNLLSTWPYFNLRVFGGCAAAIAIGCVWLSRLPAWQGLLPGIGLSAAMAGAYIVIIGPQFARQDIRSDLAHADILKTYPLPGWKIVLGEMLTPIAILTGILWLALLTAALAMPPAPAGYPWLTTPLRLLCVAWLALLTPLLVTLQLLVPNGAALVFPGWFQASRARGGGPEVAGQRMIFFFAQLVTMAVALFPAVLLAGLLTFILQGLIGPGFAVSIAALATFAILAGEIWCGLWLLGNRFEKLDLSAEVRP